MNKPGRNDSCHCGSGKKYKQCCMQNEASDSSKQAPQSVPRTVQISRALQAALEHHQLGRFAQAEPIYRQILQVDPANFDALHMLGVLAHQVGENLHALELINRAISQNQTDPLAHNNLGNAYRALGRNDEALASFRKALSLNPELFQVQNNIGEIYRAMGKLDDALASYQAVLKHDPQFAEAHNNMGLVLHMQGRYGEAIECFTKAMSCRPNYVKALRNLGSTYKEMGQFDQALASFDKAVSISPDDHETFLAMAVLFKESGQLKKALLCCQKALQTKPSEDGYWGQYAEIVRALSSNACDAVELPLILQAFEKEIVDPQSLERISTALVCSDPSVSSMLMTANQANGGAQQIESLLRDGQLNALFGNPLLLAILEECIITDYRLETLLVAVRRAMLAAHLRADGDVREVVQQRFADSLALHCFANEYIYAVTDEELQWIAGLESKLAVSIQQTQLYAPISLSLLCAYKPMHQLGFAERIQSAPVTGQLNPALVKRQLADPIREQQIKRDIASLTRIENNTSQAVRQQYEENPYPRWRRRGGALVGQTIRDGMRRRFPHLSLTAQSPTNPDILVAGCGTGSDVMQIVRSFKNANVLAVDISLSSLAYAKRATQEIGLTNIEFRQADILELGALDRQFDIIMSGGVLHHMRDPMAGWRNLVGLLRPDGFMNIGLYSRRARQKVTDMRQLIKDKGYPSTVDGIRQFRADVMHDSSVDIGALAESPDFCSTSACRDLVFHVQEHQFTALEIQACIDQLGLQFIGFEFPSNEPKKRYLDRFPENKTCDSLEKWDLIEMDNPEIFAGMFQFWVKKK